MTSEHWSKHRYLTHVKVAITHLHRVKLAFAASSLGYCAVHWLIFHGFSLYTLSGAAAFGATAAIAAGVSHGFPSPRGDTSASPPSIG